MFFLPGDLKEEDWQSLPDSMDLAARNKLINQQKNNATYTRVPDYVLTAAASAMQGPGGIGSVNGVLDSRTQLYGAGYATPLAGGAGGGYATPLGGGAGGYSTPLGSSGTATSTALLGGAADLTQLGRARDKVRVEMF